MTDATVVVPARNAEATLPETLAGLERQRFDGRFDVVVVDDGSTDATLAIAGASPVVTTVLRASGVGPAKARNLGASGAEGAVIAFLDSDCVPVPEWLATGVEALKEADFAQGMVTPRPETAVGPFDRTLWVTRASGLFESANIFVSRQLFQSLGGFESWLVPRRSKELGEDVWFGWRAQRAGARMTFVSDALAYHAVFPRTAREYVAERARLRFFPALARRMPELRERLFYRRYFLTKRSAAFDAALVGALLARRRRLGLLAAAPYGRMLLADMRGHRPAPGAKLMAVNLAADGLGFVSLAAGSIRRRSLLI